LSFEKREIVLIIGVLFLMIGMLTLLAPVCAIGIAIAIYLGIRVFVIRKKQQMQKAVGEGVCATCGEKILENKCPNCDTKNKV
jgi:phosphate/sulfate permease